MKNEKNKTRYEVRSEENVVPGREAHMTSMLQQILDHQFYTG